MSNRTEIDVQSWARKEIYNFFGKFEEPFYGVCVDLDCTHAYSEAKKHNRSFYALYLHRMMIAANSVEAFRFRIKEGRVYLYDEVRTGMTVARDNGTFGFGYPMFYADFDQFEAGLKAEIEKVKEESTLIPSDEGAMIHFSAVPYINFTSLSHARMFSYADSSPRISTGKLTLNDNGKRMMPVSIHVHHALVDGLHVGQFVDKFQALLNEVQL